MPIPVVITEWALQSYLDLYGRKVFTRTDYKTIIRPDVELLKKSIPPSDPKFSNSSFWGPATDKSGNVIQHGFKMKWHNLGPGRVQLRLGVVIVGQDVLLCQAYVKDSDATDKREMAKLKRYINSIAAGAYQTRGTL